MEVTCISDTHEFHKKVTIHPTDLLLFAGDCMGSGYDYKNLIDFLDWFSIQPAKYKVMIAGNHDRWIEDNPKEFRKLLIDYPSIIYLEDDFTIIEGLKIYGTPHSKMFYNWAFNRTEVELIGLFDKIPNDINILLSHAPPYTVLDELADGRCVGENTLKYKLYELRNLELHVFGHIHNCFGMMKPHGKHISVNASQVDENYELNNFPLIINI
jgi:Icc-related predicted phosphoesterase